MTLIGHPTPQWCTTAYLNGKEVEISSEQYKGKWHVLYWYPLDFTFICPTEIKGFGALRGDFEKEGVEVIGVSTDSYFSHNAWFADRKIFPEEITHPDPELASDFGLMLVYSTLEATLLFGEMRAVLTLSDDDLSAELTRAYLAYLGVR